MATEPYIGSIQIFGFNFAPRGFAFCNGQILAIQQNTALFSLLGTTYGGNGVQTFALPNLQGRTPIHFGQGAGLSPYALGQASGTETVTLTTPQLPPHIHTFVNGDSTLTASTERATVQAPSAGARLGRSADGSAVGSLPRIYVPAGATGGTVNIGTVNVAGTITPTGSGLPVPNLQPYLALNFSIALQGIFPSRN